MPIPLRTNFPPALNDNKPFSYKLLKAATHQMHAKGLIVVVATPMIMQDLRTLAVRNNATRDLNYAARRAVIAAYGDTPSARRRKRNATKRLRYADLLRDRLFESQPLGHAGAAAPHSAALCNTTISPDFFRDTTTSADDMRVYLALHYSTKRRQEVYVPRVGADRRPYTRDVAPLNAADGFRYRIAAFTAWKTQPIQNLVVSADYARLRLASGAPEAVVGFIDAEIESFALTEGPGARDGHGVAAGAANHHENDALGDACEERRMAFLELVCGNTKDSTNPHNVYVEGAGRDIVLFALAKIAQSKRRGDQRYTSVLTYLAYHGNPRIYPLERIMKDIGFRRVDVNMQRVDGAPTHGISPMTSTKRYYVLCDTYNAAGHVTEVWADRLARLFPDPDPLCALDTRAIRPQCI